MTVDDDVQALNRLCLGSQERPLRLPNFLGVGSSRCGTTSVFFYLRSHPDVFMSYVKEINYFGQRTRGALGPARGHSIDVYRLYFSGQNTQRMIGEISPSYLSQVRALAQIHAHLGAGCKIIAQIRQPVDRFVSLFRHFGTALNGISIDDYVAAALDRFSDQSHASRWDAPDRNLRGSLYHGDLLRYRKQFGADQVLVIEFEELRDPATLGAKICSFLDIAPFDAPIPVSHRSHGAIALSDPLRARLYDFFQPDIERTARLTGRDLSHWLRPSQGSGPA